MTTHYEEQHEIEQLRRWWRENRVPLVAGLALGLAAIFGWKAWMGHQDARAAQASQIYRDLTRAADSGKYQDAAAMGDRLAQDFDATPYAAAGAFKLAGAAVLQGKLDDAATRLRWVADYESHINPVQSLGGLLHLHPLDAPRDPALASLAHLRLAQVLSQQGKYDDALKQLDGDSGSYAALYAQQRGDIKLAQGDRAAARAAYQQALQALGADDTVSRDGLQRRLDDLADAAAEHS